jgi:lincosamide nucleotidyltransferase A/C/D/E
MNAEQVVGLVRDMKGHGIRLWLVGGWGVDALLGEHTRDHHDLDVLVDVIDLERFVERLHELGFEFAYVWEETTDARDSAWHTSGTLPTAFVYVHRDGREIDTHVLGNAEGEDPEALWNTTFVFTKAGLGADGVIAGEPVRCISAELQRLAHQGYQLPAAQAGDMRRLAMLP